MKKLFTVVCFVLFSATLLMANSDGESPLIGKWEMLDPGDGKGTGKYIEFFKDGTVSLGEGQKWDWKTEGNQLTYSFMGVFSEIHLYKISDSTLTLTSPFEGIFLMEAIYRRIE